MVSQHQESIAKEITLAMLGKVIVSTNGTTAAKEIGEIYASILKAVHKATDDAQG